MKKEVFAQWIVPATKEPWRKGFFGMCTNCNYVNNHLKVAPNFCEKCGAIMTNANMDNGQSNDWSDLSETMG